MRKFKEFVVEKNSKTPEMYVEETNQLILKVEKELKEVIKTLYELEENANGGSWFFSGLMLNDYNIEKNDTIHNLYSSLKSNVKENLLYRLTREISRNVDNMKESVKNIKKEL